LVRQYIKNSSILSESEASEMADKFISCQKQEALLAEEYNKKFKAVLSSTKVLKLYQSEIQFKRRLLKQLRQRNSKGSEEKPDM
jgi:ATP adenylyltransferase/5',5'''-P-1,P-4-tetraphosphate phosphorylase II